MIGKFLSKKYVYRLQELEEMRNALNILKTKIKFTYEPIPEIFNEISENMNKNIGSILIIPLIVWLGKLFMDKLNIPANKNYEVTFPLETQ